MSHRRFARLCRSANFIRNGERLVGAVEEFDGHEDHFLVAEIFQVVDLVPAGAIGFMAGLARLVGLFDSGAIMDVLAAAPAGHRGPEIIKHMPVEPDSLAGSEPDSQVVDL